MLLESVLEQNRRGVCTSTLSSNKKSFSFIVHFPDHPSCGGRRGRHLRTTTSVVRRRLLAVRQAALLSVVRTESSRIAPSPHPCGRCRGPLRRPPTSLWGARTRPTPSLRSLSLHRTSTSRNQMRRSSAARIIAPRNTRGSSYVISPAGLPSSSGTLGRDRLLDEGSRGDGRRGEKMSWSVVYLRSRKL